MGDPTRGFYDKFVVTRTDGDPTGRHETCVYFVLDLAHDPHARAAIAAYEQSCRSEYPILADDLQAWLSSGVDPRVSCPSHPD